MIPRFPLAPFIRSYFEDHLVCRRNASPHTIRSYRDALKLFLRFTAARLKKPVPRLLVTDLSEEVVTNFLEDLEQTRANSIQTRNHRLAALRNVFAYIASREVLLLDHCRRLADFPRKRGAAIPEIRYLEKEQMNAILTAICRDTAAGRRDYALLLFMYNTGARVQEVADTRLSWLTLTPPYKVELLGKGRKWRTCPLWESTAQQLRQLIKERQPKPGSDEFLFLNRFGHPFSRSGIADLLERYVVKASVAMPELRQHRITPHTLRHTTAMHLLQSGVEVNVIRSWLGHASTTTTNGYIEIDLTMKRKALEACEVDGSKTADAIWQSQPDILSWLDTL
jgi:site-specific recombinase XerD